MDKPRLPSEPGLYWCSLNGKDWDAILYVSRKAPYLWAEVISFEVFPGVSCHPVDSRSSAPCAIGPKIDHPSCNASTGSSSLPVPM